MWPLAVGAEAGVGLAPVHVPAHREDGRPGRAALARSRARRSGPAAWKVGARAISAATVAGRALCSRIEPGSVPLGHAATSPAARLLRRGRLRRQPAGRVPRRRRGAARAAPGGRRRPRPERDRVRRRRRARRGSASSRRPRSSTSPAIRAWAPRGCSSDIDALRPPAGEVAVTREGDDVYVTARPEWGPPWPLVAARLARGGRGARRSARRIRPGGRVGMDRRGPRARSARARSAGGSASPRTRRPAPPPRSSCAQAGRPIDIRQGRGSRILARPAGDGFVEIGGRSALDEVRDYALP